MLPLAACTAESLVHWLAPMGERRTPGAMGAGAWPGPRGGDWRLVPDLDRIDALSGEREALWSRIGAADFLTRDEKRQAVGYGAEGGGAGRKAAPGRKYSPNGKYSPDRKYSPDQPRVPAGSAEGGRWAGGEGNGSLAGGAGHDILADPPGPTPATPLDQMMQHLRDAAWSQSTGKCAKYVRRALAAGGISIKVPAAMSGNASASAADFGPSLIEAGATVVADVQGQDAGMEPADFPPSGYTASPGDVIIFSRFESHPHGHMAMFNGDRWISDFVQKGPWPNQTRAKAYGPSYTIYRFPSLQGT